LHTPLLLSLSRPALLAVAQVKFGTYIKKRDKPMPWKLNGGTDCDLFDYGCSAKLKAAKEGGVAH
jgi:hypothetical protein